MGQTKVCNADSKNSALTKLKAKIQSCNASLLPMALAFHKQGSKALKPTVPVFHAYLPQCSREPDGGPQIPVILGSPLSILSSILHRLSKQLMCTSCHD